MVVNVIEQLFNKAESFFLSVFKKNEKDEKNAPPAGTEFIPSSESGW